jgi:hypothetical protein
MTRMDPKKKALYSIVLEKMTLSTLLEYKIESVFLSDDEKDKSVVQF